MNLSLDSTFDGLGNLVGGVGSNDGNWGDFDGFIVGLDPGELIEAVTRIAHAAGAAIANRSQTLLQRRALFIAHGFRDGQGRRRE